MLRPTPRFEPAQWPLADRWLAHARRDLDAAILLIESEHLKDVAAEHCHQAAEKLAKATLVLHLIPPDKTHDIERLAEKLADVAPQLADLLSRVAPASWSYVALRYPDVRDEPKPGAEAVRAAIVEINAALDQMDRMRASTTGEE